MNPTAAVERRLRADGAMRSDVGAVRQLNEDSVVYVAPRNGDPAAVRGSLMLVADGMGGHAAGEVASDLAAKTIRRVYYEFAGEVPELLASAFLAANRAILDWAEQNPECKGMGTTCTAVALRDGQAWLGHIGDSRAYLLRNGILTQLSDDQTLVAQMVREGKLSPEDAHNSPVSNVILQALGSSADIAPDIWSEPLALAAGDILVLCTDGLTGVVPDATIADQVERLPPDEACEGLIDLALAAGGPDNVSVGVFRIVADANRQDGDQPADAAGTTRRVALSGEESANQGSEQTRQLELGRKRTSAQ